MAYYASNQGYSQGTGENLTKKMWDKVLHEQVQDKSFFKGLMGKDKGGEGSISEEMANFPIVEKTQLGKEGGDQVTLGLVKQLGNQTLYTTTGAVNDGKVGNVQLVDSENAMTFHNLKVKLAHLRDGVAIFGKMTEQRSPFDLQKTASSLLSTRLAKHLDDGLFFSLYTGFSPNILRELGTATVAAVAHPNQMFGNTSHANYAAMTNVSTNNLNTAYLDALASILAVENINPCMVDGEPKFLFIAHPYATKTLRADSLWANAQYYVAEKGKKNPLFSGSIGQWNGIIVRESNKITTPLNVGTIAASSGTFTTLAAATDPTSSTTAVIRANIVLGANAVARAYGLESYMAKRKEDDYGNLIGFGGGSIYGDARADWVNSSDDSGTDATVNQSSLIAHTYSPAVSSAVSIW